MNIKEEDPYGFKALGRLAQTMFEGRMQEARQAPKKKEELPQRLECNMAQEHIAFFYALSLIDRLMGRGEEGVSAQTASYIRLEVAKALSSDPLKKNP